jgi:hypothetical protein
MLVIAACAVAALFASIPAGCGDDANAGDAQAPDATEGPEAGDATTLDVGDAAPPLPKGSRVLGVAVAVDDLDFPNNVQIARDAGARTANTTFGWDDIERPYDAGAADDGGDAATDGGTPTQLFNPVLHIVNLVLSDSRVAVTLTVDALDVGGSRAPAELATRPLDDVEVGARYDRMIDYVLTQLHDVDVTAILVATSVDVPLGDDAAKHAAFATFLGRAAAHVHAVRPDLPVGFTVTASGAVARKGRLGAAWAAADVLGVTYFPIDAAAQVRPASEVGADVDALVAALPAGKPILLREAGYPTAAACGGSDAAQAAFVTALFGAWDRHADRIPVVTFRELVDARPDTASAEALRSGRSDAAFLAFLWSLGLRGAGGTKPGFDALISGARARGF